MEKRFYTVNEVAEMTGFHPKTIREFISTGLIEAVRFRTEYRITQEAIEDYIKRNSTKRDQNLDTAEVDPTNHN